MLHHTRTHGKHQDDQEPDDRSGGRYGLIFIGISLAKTRQGRRNIPGLMLGNKGSLWLPGVWPWNDLGQRKYWLGV